MTLDLRTWFGDARFLVWSPSQNISSKITLTLHMHFPTLVTVFLCLFAINISALSLVQKGLLGYDMPICAVTCGGKAAKTVRVSYFDGRGNCVRPDYQSEWKNCLKTACTDRNRRKARRSSLFFDCRQSWSMRNYARVMDWKLRRNWWWRCQLPSTNNSLPWEWEVSIGAVQSISVAYLCANIASRDSGVLSVPTFADSPDVLL